MPAPIKLLALRPGPVGAGWQEWHVDFALVGFAGPAGEPVVVRRPEREYYLDSAGCASFASVSQSGALGGGRAVARASGLTQS